MGIAPYQRSYQRARPGRGAQAAGYVSNPAAHLTDQGGDPDAADLAWCIRRRWRVIYYGARRAAGQPLWHGADDFEVVMISVLATLSSAYKPIPPIRSAKVALPEDDDLADTRKERIYQLSCRVFRAPVLDKRE